MSSNLTWPQARDLALAGQKIRRAAWVDRWWLYDRCLWWLAPFNAVTKVAGALRVILATDITRSEFDAADWTTDEYVAPATPAITPPVIPTTVTTTPTVTATGFFGTGSTYIAPQQTRTGWNLRGWASEVAAGRATVDQATGMLTWYWPNGGAVRMRVQLQAVYA